MQWTHPDHPFASPLPLAVLASLCAVPLRAQVQWRDLGPRLRSRSLHAMAYDAGRQRVVMFGGIGDRVLADTW